VLFHSERAAALLAAWVFVLVIFTRAWAGELPSEMSSQGIRYATPPDVTTAAFQSLVANVELLQLRMDAVEDERD
jgi:hypothetical protein